MSAHQYRNFCVIKISAQTFSNNIITCTRSKLFALHHSVERQNILDPQSKVRASAVRSNVYLKNLRAVSLLRFLSTYCTYHIIYS